MPRLARDRSQDIGSPETLFHLKQGDKLPPEKAPRIAGRPLEITVNLSGHADGVLVAQGGLRYGYALYIMGGKLALATRQAGEQTIVAADTKLPEGDVQVAAALAKDGTITLRVAGKQVAVGKARGPITQMPWSGVQVGQNELSPVGPYQAPFSYGGRIVSVEIRLGN